jgi:hypothetical protein
MYDRARSLYVKGKEAITQACVFPLEAHLLDMVTETLLPHWRAYGVPDVSELTRVESRMATDAYSLLDCLDKRQKDNQAPTISFRAPSDGLTLALDAVAEDDGVIVTAYWDFGDGAHSADLAASHTYDQPGTYLVSCTVTDDRGVSATDWRYYEVPVNADIAGDNGRVDIRDLAELGFHWRRTGCGEPNWCGGADLDRSGAVDFGDLYLLSGNWLSPAAEVGR